MAADRALRDRFDRAFADLDAPFAFVDLDAVDANTTDLRRRAHGKPIRVASKSVRCRAILDRVLSEHGYAGILAFTLPEALWLTEVGTCDDVVVGYPTADRGAIAALLQREPDHAPVLMVDDVAHLDLVDAVASPAERPPVRVCLDLDAALWLLDGRVRLGPRRSPIHTVDDAVALARTIVARPGFDLVGVMAYEGQIAGLGNRPRGRPVYGAVVRAMQRMSAAELRKRRGEVVAAVREVTDLRFVNGGGTGSLEVTAADAAVTELAAGSGLYAPHLFDDYGHFTLVPAAGFALPIVRRPGPGVATALGGGYLASGPGDTLRLPVPWLPEGLSLDRQEGAGEVQTPLLGDAADELAVGDLVYLRHTKAGELCERFDVLHLVRGDEVVDTVPTYRGEGKTFL